MKTLAVIAILFATPANALDFSCVTPDFSCVTPTTQPSPVVAGAESGLTFPALGASLPDDCPDGTCPLTTTQTKQPVRQAPRFRWFRR